MILVLRHAVGSNEVYSRVEVKNINLASLEP